MNQHQRNQQAMKNGPQWEPKPQPPTIKIKGVDYVVTEKSVTVTKRSPLAFLIGALLIVACCLASFLALGGANLLQNLK